MEGMHQKAEAGFDLRSARINAGMTVSQASKACGVAAHTYVRVEQGQSVWPSSAVKVANYFNCRATDLLRDEAA